VGDHEGVPQDIEILFKDDGPGIQQEIRRKLFEPYNTSKGATHSGLGLSIAHTIITALEGSITCLDRSGRGTVFKITLPSAPL
jgi:signal transduction histidine kinase